MRNTTSFGQEKDAVRNSFHHLQIVRTRILSNRVTIGKAITMTRTTSMICRSSTTTHIILIWPLAHVSMVLTFRPGWPLTAILSVFISLSDLMVVASNGLLIGIWKAVSTTLSKENTPLFLVLKIVLKTTTPRVILHLSQIQLRHCLVCGTLTLMDTNAKMMGQCRRG